MPPQRPLLSSDSVYRKIIRDVCRTVGLLIVGCVAIGVLSVWHRLVSAVQSSSVESPPSVSADDSDVAIIEHELDWYQYIKAFDAHHGPGGDPERDIQSGSFLRGLRVWMTTQSLRGYTLGNEVYVCPNAPTVLRVHQAGHAPAFGREFPTLVYPRRQDGGLEDAPLRTFDVMLPGDFPHTLLRFRDPRGLTETYREWLRNGRIARING